MGDNKVSAKRAICVCHTYKAFRWLGVILISCGIVSYHLLAIRTGVSVEIPDATTTDSGQSLQAFEYEANAVLSHKKIVIIVAYMRSGSTFAGSIFQEYHPHTLYVFEPFKNVMKKFKALASKNITFTTLQYMHGKERKYTVNDTDKAILDEINRWLMCNLGSLSIPSLNSVAHLHHTKIMKSFYLCSKRAFSTLSRLTNVTSPIDRRRYYEIDICLKVAERGCEAAPMIALKFIRLRMKYVLSLLSLYPNMKVIHLVRDTRGMMSSRLELKGAKLSYNEVVQKVCAMVEDDLHYSKIIIGKYSDRLKIVHYEDLAESPMATARSMCEFAGIDLSQHLQEYIKSQTSAAQDTCRFCTARSNSSETASKWRATINYADPEYIYGTCKLSNEILGYLPLTNATLNDTTVPSRWKTNVTEELWNNNI